MDPNPQAESIRQTVFDRAQEEWQRWGPKADPDDNPQSKQQALSSQDILEALNRNQDGDASLFIRLHRGRFVYDHAAGCWHMWSGHFWEDDILNEVMAGIEKVVEVYSQEQQLENCKGLKAAKKGEEEEAKYHFNIAKGLLKRIQALQTKARKGDILFLAATGTGSLGIAGSEWDLDPWLLGCLNGVVDLRTGKHRPGRPDDFIRTVAKTEWKGLNEPAPTWERFLTEIFSGNTELIAYIKRLCGYCITGRTTEHFLIILWGKGRNGKGTLLETLNFVLGSYAGPVEAELILKQRFLKPSGGPTPDIMNLRGKRLAWVSETNEGRKINAGKIKWLTGGDSLTGREMYGRRPVNFNPSHKLLLLTNHKPHAAADDYALWHRIYLIPFTLSFVNDPKLPNERQADPTLPDKLRAEASGILSWLVRGCLAWQQEGLCPPEAVKIATEEYRQEEDTIGIFITECCDIGDKLEVQAGVLYDAYKKWTEENGLYAVNGTVFGKQIKERFGSYESRNRMFYIGLNVRGC